MHLYIGLVHYPVYNKNHKIIASAVTTLDLHDISRIARTYDAKMFFVVTPLEDQQELVERVKRHWVEGYGARYNEHRKSAIELVSVVPSIEAARSIISENEGENPLVIATDASEAEGQRLSYEKARELISSGDQAVLIIFGTAWGIDRDTILSADYLLDPIYGKTDYNHLSVRAAAAIILDRLAGRENQGLG